MISLGEILCLSGVLEAFGAKPDDGLVPRFSTDTRTIASGQSFIALDGERFRPMRFLEKLEACPVVVYTKNKENDKLAKAARKEFFFIAVEDSVVFLQNIARAVSEAFTARGGKLIAIGGSNGKTTTKEMLYHLLKAADANTVRTRRNNNNHIGVPLTLLQIRENTRFCALELGSNHPGEIQSLCDISRPNVGVVTNIGDTHLEFFHNRENVFKEEGGLYSFMESSRFEEKLFFLNKDDDWLKKLPKKDFVKTFGEQASNDIIIEHSHAGAAVTVANGKISLENEHITGEHNFQNLAVAFAIANELVGEKNELVGDKKGVLVEASRSFVPAGNRSQWIETHKGKVFLDAYNANPSSMRTAIKGFKQKALAEGAALEEMALVLGDMNELGDEAGRYHRELGSFCDKEGFGRLFFIGRYAKDYNSGCGGKGEEFATVADFEAKRKDEFLAHKRSFIKGSRSLQLESIVDIN